MAERYWAHSDPDAPDTRRRTRHRPPVQNIGRLCRGPHLCLLHPDGPVDNDCGNCPPLTTDPVCPVCRRRLRAVLSGWPRLYVDLAQALEPGRRPRATGVRVSGGGELGAPLPLDAAPEALMRKAVEVFDLVAAAVRKDTNLQPGRRAGRDGRRFASNARMLLAHSDTLTALQPARFLWPISEREVPDVPVDTVGAMATSGEAWIVRTLDGPAIVCDLIRLYDRARRLLGKTIGREPQPGIPCPLCYNQTLIRWHGRDVIECATPACPFVTTAEDLERWKAWLLSAQGMTLHNVT